MQYKILVSDDYLVDSFYVENKAQAELLFNMAVESKMFTYVQLTEIREESSVKKEWAEGDDSDGKR
jgi:hypothetical protein